MIATKPADDAGWFRLVYDNQPHWWAGLAEACGGRSLVEEGGVHAAVVPACPERSFFNGVHYSDTAALLAALPRLAASYDEAPVDAWTVWIPETDSRAAAALEGAGHVLDAEPQAMALELDELRPTHADPSLEIREEVNLDLLRELNEIAYGYPDGQFPPMALAWSDARFYFGGFGGETVSCLMTWDRGANTEITFVATLPEARNRGFAKRLMLHALERAAERGQDTSTLVASKLGYPVYEGLGYRRVGGLQMWERRRA
ncbi:MAG: GNAT family N-acetyltransferase [Solirubrobacterales bacterium]|nr:GNAT family N-acetyltransferase [Solirubrobacterales bacterium]